MQNMRFESGEVGQIEDFDARLRHAGLEQMHPQAKY
jgi:hypothetical protein